MEKNWISIFCFPLFLDIASPSRNVWRFGGSGVSVCAGMSLSCGAGWTWEWEEDIPLNIGMKFQPVCDCLYKLKNRMVQSTSKLLPVFLCPVSAFQKAPLGKTPPLRFVVVKRAPLPNVVAQQTMPDPTKSQGTNAPQENAEEPFFSLTPARWRGSIESMSSEISTGGSGLESPFVAGSTANPQCTVDFLPSADGIKVWLSPRWGFAQSTSWYPSNNRELGCP